MKSSRSSSFTYLKLSVIQTQTFISYYRVCLHSQAVVNEDLTPSCSIHYNLLCKFSPNLVGFG